ncbi:MAG: FAD:protein FMN transferase [Actinomycetota bacterium]|nr:FAD:protein FMN transferase [Actinomycetota bacterium]
MACELHVMTVGAPEGAVAEAVALLDRLEGLWSRFLPSSDITRLNLADGFPTAVAPETFMLLQTMQEAHRLTAGAFDPSVLRALVAHGYGASRADAAQHTVLAESAAESSRFSDVDVDPLSELVTLPKGLAIDAGGIGKGLAADLAVVALLSRGAAGALVSIGGDLAMAGESPLSDGWVVEVEHADPAAGVLCRFAVSGGGVATSSTVSRRWTTDGAARHHVIDPATGRQSTTDLACVTVIGRSGWSAEAHATGALLTGSAGAIEYLLQHQASGVVQTTSGHVLLTPDLQGLGLEGVA